MLVRVSMKRTVGMLALLVWCLGLGNEIKSAPPFSLLLVTSFYGGPYQGLTGVDRYVFNYAAFLQKKKIPVTVLVQHGTVIKQMLSKAGIPCFSWAFHSKKRSTQGALGALMNQIIEQHRITHVHCNMLSELHPIHAAIKKYKLPLFYTHHYQYGFPIDKYQFLKGVCVVDKLLVASLTNAVAVQQEKPGKRKKTRSYAEQPPVVKFIPPLLDEDRLIEQAAKLSSPAPAVPTIVTVGNMYNDLTSKNYPLLIKAVHRLINHYKQPCKVLIVGDGPTRKTVEALIAKKHLADHITLLGHRSDVPAILATADVVVLTSKHEGFGMVLAEANMVGKPVIGPRDTGVEGVIADGVNGLLFANGDADDFCKKCLMLFNNPTERLAMGVRAQKYAVEHFSSARILQELFHLYGIDKISAG
jgi:glycosyltransferase involved in cell wall biosynthesis